MKYILTGLCIVALNAALLAGFIYAIDTEFSDKVAFSQVNK